MWVNTGRNNQTKGKKNNFCIVYFEEVVVANVLFWKSVTWETSQSPIGPLEFGQDPLTGVSTKQLSIAVCKAALSAGAKLASTTIQPK